MRKGKERREAGLGRKGEVRVGGKEGREKENNREEGGMEGWTAWENEGGKKIGEKRGKYWNGRNKLRRR